MTVGLNLTSPEAFIPWAGTALGATPGLRVHGPDGRVMHAEAKMPPSDTFFGERVGVVTTPFGNSWGIARFPREVPHAETEKGAAEFAAKMAKQ